MLACWYFVRDSENRDEFFTVPGTWLSMWTVETGGSYADLDGSELRAKVVSNER